MTQVVAAALSRLAPDGLRRVSAGSALYRHALAAALDTAAAARTGASPATTAVDDAGLQHRLRHP